MQKTNIRNWRQLVTMRDNITVIIRLMHGVNGIETRKSERIQLRVYIIDVETENKDVWSAKFPTNRELIRRPKLKKYD